MSKTILIIEDDTMIGELYQIVLSQAGYFVLWAKDGDDGWLRISQGPDLILLDIMMPKMNGIDLLEKLKADEEKKTIPVIILSNLAQKDIVSKAIQLGALGYLLKVNILPEQLVTIVDRYFENPEAALPAEPDGLILTARSI